MVYFFSHVIFNMKIPMTSCYWLGTLYRAKSCKKCLKLGLVILVSNVKDTNVKNVFFNKVKFDSLLSTLTVMNLPVRSKSLWKPLTSHYGMKAGQESARQIVNCHSRLSHRTRSCLLHSSDSAPNLLQQANISRRDLVQGTWQWQLCIHQQRYQLVNLFKIPIRLLVKLP